MTAGDPIPAVPSTSSFDEVVRKVLDIIGMCLLNNSPEQSNFGGVVYAGVGNRLTVGVQSVQTPGQSGVVQGNDTLELGNINSWVQSISQS